MVHTLYEGLYRDVCWYNELDFPNHLQHTKIEYVDQETCEKEQELLKVGIDKSVICTSMEITDEMTESRACSGDSGGVLISCFILFYFRLRALC